MIQSFQCPVCGNLNAFGEPSCTRCGQNFVYNCPVCGNPVNNHYANCPSCQTLFNWSRESGQSYQPARSDASAPQGIQSIGQNPYTAPGSLPGASDSQPEQSNDVPAAQSQIVPGRSPRAAATGMTSRPAFWVMLMICCIIIIAVLLFVDRIINA